MNMHPIVSDNFSSSISNRGKEKIERNLRLSPEAPNFRQAATQWNPQSCIMLPRQCIWRITHLIMGSTKASMLSKRLPKLANGKYQGKGRGLSCAPPREGGAYLHLIFTAVNSFMELGASARPALSHEKSGRHTCRFPFCLVRMSDLNRSL